MTRGTIESAVTTRRAQVGLEEMIEPRCSASGWLGSDHRITRGGEPRRHKRLFLAGTRLMKSTRIGLVIRTTVSPIRTSAAATISNCTATTVPTDHRPRPQNGANP